MSGQVVKQLDETVIQEIGHAFGYYDYGPETGMNACFRSPDATAEYICGYVRCALAAGLLYTTSERGEGYIAYKLPGQKIPLRTMKFLLQGICRSMRPSDIFRFVKAMAGSLPSLEDQMKKQKKPYVFVGMVCVREKYQGQGYMRKVLDIAFAEGNRLGIPVILETDAMSKCEKYMHLGMQLAGTIDLGSLGKLYDLIKYPDEP